MSENNVLSYPRMARQREENIQSQQIAFAEDVNAEFDHIVDVYNRLVMMLTGEWGDDTGRIYQLVDQAITTANAALAKSNASVQKSGDTMTGHLNIALVPASDYNVVNKKYVDDVVAGAVSGPISDIDILENALANLDAEHVKLNNTNFKGKNVHEGMNELFISVSNGKQVIASAITGKGVPTDADDSFDTMADHINAIVTFNEGAAGGTATPADVLKGKTFYARKNMYTGTLDMSDASAGPAQILKGYTAYVNGNKIEGTYTPEAYPPSDAPPTPSIDNPIVDVPLSNVTPIYEKNPNALWAYATIGNYGIEATAGITARGDYLFFKKNEENKLKLYMRHLSYSTLEEDDKYGEAKLESEGETSYFLKDLLTGNNEAEFEQWGIHNVAISRVPFDNAGKKYNAVINMKSGETQWIVTFVIDYTNVNNPVLIAGDNKVLQGGGMAGRGSVISNAVFSTVQPDVFFFTRRDWSGWQYGVNFSLYRGKITNLTESTNLTTTYNDLATGVFANTDYLYMLEGDSCLMHYCLDASHGVTSYDGVFTYIYPMDVEQCTIRKMISPSVNDTNNGIVSLASDLSYAFFKGSLYKVTVNEDYTMLFTKVGDTVLPFDTDQPVYFSMENDIWFYPKANGTNHFGVDTGTLRVYKAAYDGSVGLKLTENDLANTGANGWLGIQRWGEDGSFYSTRSYSGGKSLDVTYLGYEDTDKIIGVRHNGVAYYNLATMNLSALPADVRSGKTFYGQQAIKQTGTATISTGGAN